MRHVGERVVVRHENTPLATMVDKARCVAIHAIKQQGSHGGRQVSKGASS